MSQEKVERYKKEKANRKQAMKKQRIMNVMRKCGSSRLRRLRLLDGLDIRRMILILQTRSGK